MRLVRNESNIGLTRSLNVGLAAARGELIARQDADDLSRPDRLVRQVAAFSADPDLALIGAQARAVDARGRRRAADEWRKCVTPLGIEWQLMFENAFVHSAVMFRRNLVVREFGGYNETFRTNQDYELWSRIASRHRVANVDAELVDLRNTPASISKSYSVDAIRRVGDLLVETRSRCLRQVCVWDKGLEVLLTATNPRVCAPVRDVQPLISSTRYMLKRFTVLHPEASEVAEIRSHAASILSRVARLVASHAPKAAWDALNEVRLLDARLFRRAVMPVAVRIGTGPVLRHRRPAASTSSMPSGRASAASNEWMK
jgi:glycosyltransferase involved in cell wall biosynthesis